MLGVVNEDPVNNNVPPEAALYQKHCSGEVATKVRVPVPQRLTAGADGAAGTELMMASTAVLVLAQPLFASE